MCDGNGEQKGSMVASENHKEILQSAYPSYYITAKKLETDNQKVHY